MAKIFNLETGLSIEPTIEQLAPLNDFSVVRQRANEVLERVRSLNDEQIINPDNLEIATARARHIRILRGLREYIVAAQTSGESGQPMDWLRAEDSREVKNLLIAMTMMIEQYEHERAAQQRVQHVQTSAEIRELQSTIVGGTTGQTVEKSLASLRDTVYNNEVKVGLAILMGSGPGTSDKIARLLKTVVTTLNEQFQQRRPGVKTPAATHTPLGPVFGLKIQERKWFGWRKAGQVVEAQFQLMADESLHTVSLQPVNQAGQKIWDKSSGLV